MPSLCIGLVLMIRRWEMSKRKGGRLAGQELMTPDVTCVTQGLLSSQWKVVMTC